MFKATSFRQSALHREVAEGQTPARFPAPGLAPFVLISTDRSPFPLNRFLASVLCSDRASAVSFASVPLLSQKSPLACSLLGLGDQSSSVLLLLAYTILKVTNLVGWPSPILPADIWR